VRCLIIALANRIGDEAHARSHLAAAHQIYSGMQADGFAERTRQLAEDLGIVFLEVALPEPFDSAGIRPATI